jgi:hypothetical protein
MEMTKVQLIGISQMGNNLNAVVHINNNEGLLNFKIDDLSRESQDKILAILTDYFDGLGITELTNKLTEV